ncbi:hypothetical protein WJX72_010141 [[Myrmecia] bisecta]|uniref:Uncharacterized protein n=1 Tax=[Myrmecia] bisecta TaxID=41462 RepID=A0AAW1R9G8_9CHLO
MYSAVVEKVEETVENLLHDGPHSSPSQGQDLHVLDTGDMIRGSTVDTSSTDPERPLTPDQSKCAQPSMEDTAPSSSQAAEDSSQPGSQAQQPSVQQIKEEQAGPQTSKQKPKSNAEFRQQEEASEHGWLAEFLGHLWMPNLMVASNKIAWETLPELLSKSKPGWMSDITLKKFKLGGKPPVLSNIKPWKDTSRVGDEQVGLDCDVLWESNQDIELQIYPFPKPLASIFPDVIEDMISKIVSFETGVKKLKLKAKLRITFDPLLDRVPVVGSIKVAFREQPEYLDFDVTILGGKRLDSLVPSLKSFLVTFVRDSLISMYLLPDHYTYQIDMEAKDIEVPEGLLEVVVVEARNVPSADYFGAPDPYVELSVRESQKRVTSIKHKGKHPVWNESFQMPVHIRDMQKLTAMLRDHDEFLGDDELGRAEVKLKELQPDQKHDLWLPTFQQGQEVKEAQKASQRSERQQHRAEKHEEQGRSWWGRKKDDPCELHLQVTYSPFTEEEMHAIAESQQKDDPSILMGLPRLATLARQGVVIVNVIAVRNLTRQPWWRGSHRKLQVEVRIGDTKKQTTVYKGSRRGSKIDETLQLDVTGSARDGKEQDCIVVEVVDTKFFNTSQGTVKIPLEELKRVGHMKRPFKLQGEGVVDMEVEWRAVI